MLDAGEECDDCNAVGGDGCSSGCELEPGFMCTDAVRPVEAWARPGELLHGGPERCTAPLCERPRVWSSFAGSPYARGVYCGTFCASNISAQPGFRVTADCVQENVDECALPARVCPAAMLGTDLVPQFECSCPSHMFEVAERACAHVGAVVSVRLQLDTPGPGDALAAAALAFQHAAILALQAGGYVRDEAAACRVERR